MPVVPWTEDSPLFEGTRIVFGVPRRPTLPAGRDNDASSILTQRFDEALVYASELHRAQRRTGTAVPYLSHLLGTAALALEMGADEDQAIAALLHDSVEDQGGTPRLDDISARFGDRVAGIVADCSDWDGNGTPPPWRARKEAYIACLAAKSAEALLVILADKTHNARTIVDHHTVHGADLWNRFAAGRDGSLWYYTALAEAFSRAFPGAGAARLAKLVGRMSKLD